MVLGKCSLRNKLLCRRLWTITLGACSGRSQHNRTIIKTRASRQPGFCMCSFKFGQMVHSDFSRHSVKCQLRRYNHTATRGGTEDRRKQEEVQRTWLWLVETLIWWVVQMFICLPHRLQLDYWRGSPVINIGHLAYPYTLSCASAKI